MRWCIREAAILGMLCLASASPSLAQPASSSDGEDPLGYGFFQAGILGMDLGGLNTRLAAAGLPALDESVPTWGGGGYGVVGRFHFGAVGHGGLDPTEVSGSNRVGLSGGYGLARVRYEALSAGDFTLYPALGVGSGAMSLKIADLDAPTFDDVLDDPGRSSTLSTGLIFLMNAGLAVDYRFQIKELDDGGGWGFVVGVEGGYMYSPGSTSWTLDDINDVVAGPNLGIEGFYVWISLGGWGREGVGPVP
jgi:hypothetical protein